MEDHEIKKEPIQYNYIGTPPLTVSEKDDEINFIKFRINKI